MYFKYKKFRKYSISKSVCAVSKYVKSLLIKEKNLYFKPRHWNLCVRGRAVVTKALLCVIEGDTRYILAHNLLLVFLVSSDRHIWIDLWQS